MDDDAEQRFRDTTNDAWNQERDEHRQEDQQRHRKRMERSTLHQRMERERPPQDHPEPDRWATKHPSDAPLCVSGLTAPGAGSMP